MKFMVTWSYPAERREAVAKKWDAGSKKLQDTEGVKNLGRWHGVGTNSGFGLFEATDPLAFAESFSEWGNLIDYEVTLVVSDEDLGV